jgi:hypothetical protein
MTLVTRSPRASHRCRWCATETTTIRFPRATVFKRFWRRDMSTGFEIACRASSPSAETFSHAQDPNRTAVIASRTCETPEYGRADQAVGAGMRIGVRRDNQGENPTTMRMRMRRCWDDEGRAEPDWSRRHPSDLRPFGCLLLDRAMPVLCCPIAGGEERFHPTPR